MCLPCPAAQDMPTNLAPRPKAQWHDTAVVGLVRYMNGPVGQPLPAAACHYLAPSSCPSVPVSPCVAQRDRFFFSPAHVFLTGSSRRMAATSTKTLLPKKA